jgi:flavodoxin
MSDNAKKVRRIDLLRRSLLAYAAVELLAGIASPVLGQVTAPTATAKATGGRKSLIVYFSRTGNTRELAGQIHELIGGDQQELETVAPYPEDYEAVKAQARREQASGYKPALTTKVANIRSYDLVYVGTPIWWATLPPPVRTFLSEYDLSDKTIVPFVTHAGSGFGSVVGDIAALCPRSVLVKGIAVWGKEAKSARSTVAEWLRREGLRT